MRAANLCSSLALLLPFLYWVFVIIRASPPHKRKLRHCRLEKGR